MNYIYVVSKYSDSRDMFIPDRFYSNYESASQYIASLGETGNVAKVVGSYTYEFEVGSGFYKEIYRISREEVYD